MSRYSGQDLEKGKRYWLDQLDKRIQDLEDLGRRRADTEKFYRMAVSKELLKMITIRSGTVKIEIAKGKDDIALLREQRDIAVVLHNTALQSIFQAKIELNIIESDILHERTGR